ncbi:uncharacterized protein LOC141854531 isoform X2 [Brevipalpus obovatus]|uniref:uncharacterized protein LOC141854531 isoform X2 n=1 Tax=Brevipalpus obovatus TaxID=246614 RepID=UPI003D9FA3A4
MAPIPGPLDGPGLGGGIGGGIGPANIENVDYAIDAQTVAPVSDSIGTRLFGGSLFNRLGASRRSVVLRRRTFRPNGVTLVELEEPGPFYGGGGFLTRFWPFALENGNNTRTKHVDGMKDFRDEHPEHRDEDRGFMSISPKRPRAFLRRG